jgi:hypothetical protein
MLILPFRPGMTAQLILLLKQKKNISAANSCVVVKSDTAAVSDVKANLPLIKKEALRATRSNVCFVKVGDKAKIRVIKPEFKMILILKEERS